MAEVNRNGLTDLTSGASNEPYRVNIILVHGLRGHPRKTWEGKAGSVAYKRSPSRSRPWLNPFYTKKQLSTKRAQDTLGNSEVKPAAFWPRDYLLADLPEARVWTYGYNADVVAGFFTPPNKNTVSQYGRDLAVRLERDVDNELPVIFVAHSLGGIVVKDALHKSPMYRERTGLVIFLGTPHRGSSYAGWGVIASNLARLAFQDSHKKLVETLDVNSEVLDNIHEDFKSTVTASSVKIHSFQEARSISGMKGLDEKVVDDFSSKLDLAREVETVESIDANHMQMARCDSREDENYLQVLGVLKQFLKNRRLRQGLTSNEVPAISLRNLQLSEEQRQADGLSSSLSPRDAQLRSLCLKSLYFKELENRQSYIESAEEGTCTWLSRHETFQDWHGRKRGLLWIKGKPGSGKSTLMKHLLDQPSYRSLARCGALTLSFFFHARGTQLQRTRFGLLRSLLYQVLHQAPDSASELILKFQQRCEVAGQPGKDWDWNEPELQRFLESAVLHILAYSSIRIFVDALDECGDEEAIQLVRIFSSLLEKARDMAFTLNICFSCRHYPILDPIEGLVICVEEENNKDIEHYTYKRLQSYNLQSSQIATLIVEKASGAFQWVSLVVQIVEKRRRNGHPLSKIEAEVTSIPGELPELYKELFGQIARQNKTRGLKLLQWVSFAVRPLSIDELLFALEVDADLSWNAPEESRSTVEDKETKERRVKSLSCGLVEVKWYGGGSAVQFIHQTVKDYAFQDGIRILDQDATTASAHYRLSRSCINVLRLYASGRSQSYYTSPTYREASFHLYAASAWTQHTSKANAAGVAQDDLLSFFEWPSNNVLDTWIGIWESNRWWSIERPSRGTNLLHLASRYGLFSCAAKILSITKQEGMIIDLKDRYGRTPLSWAAGNGHTAVVELLVEREDVEADSKDMSGQTPLSLAAMYGHKAVVELLVEREDVEADSKDNNGQTPLSLAAENGHKAVVKLLVEREDVEADSKDNDSQTPLSWAAVNGHKAVIELLVARKDVEADSKDKFSKTPLSRAAVNGHKAVVELLVARKDVEADLKDKFSKTPLSQAAVNGHKAVVELLVEREDVEADSKDNNGQTPLSWAAENGHTAVVELLVEREDVEADSKDNNSQTPLSRAAIYGHKAVVKLLVEREDVEADSKDNNGLTPLSRAAVNRHTAVVKLLVEREDVEANSKDNNSQTPLSLAAMYGHKAVVKLLVERKDVEADSKDNNGRTPLSWAAVNGHKAVVELLVARKDVEADLKDKFSKTPLSRAAVNGHKAVVKLLVEREDVEADLKDNNGLTPLSRAAIYGHTAVVELLVERKGVKANGADV